MSWLCSVMSCREIMWLLFVSPCCQPIATLTVTHDSCQLSSTSTFVQSKSRSRCQTKLVEILFRLHVDWISHCQLLVMRLQVVKLRDTLGFQSLLTLGNLKCSSSNSSGIITGYCWLFHHVRFCKVTWVTTASLSPA